MKLYLFENYIQNSQGNKYILCFDIASNTLQL